MAISRILSQSLARASLAPSNALITHHRHRSTKPARAQLIEVDLDSDSPDPEAVSLGVKRLQDAIHSIIVRRAAPYWLPFLPGHSYWVPPRAASSRYTLASISHPLQHQLLSEDEQMSLLSANGWPSSTYFIQGTSPQHPIPMLIFSDTSSSKDEP
ncbi:uncharacterized protein LOC121799432 [Salvia splendens]|uniref:uncharacterized protein LOC121799432 n=1 Tax=Salvia splendens TaxID=180675 RepID=UPI001C27509B|nr:uncharacterized protein LOC121799432 [Salvia splendens]